MRRIAFFRTHSQERRVSSSVFMVTHNIGFSAYFHSPGGKFSILFISIVQELQPICDNFNIRDRKCRICAVNRVGRQRQVRSLCSLAYLAYL